MTDWIKHNGGPQPVGDDVWVETSQRHGLGEDSALAGALDWRHIERSRDIVHFRILNQHLIDAKQAEIDALQHEVMWLYNALEQTGDAVVYGYTLLDDMDVKIDAARLEGIRLGLEAAATEVWIGALGGLSLEEGTNVIRNLNPDTIAREAVLDQLTSEAQADNMGYDND